jgi:hypothetical protein
MAFTMNEGGAPIPQVPGAGVPSFSTRFLQNQATGQLDLRQQTVSALQGGAGTAYVFVGKFPQGPRPLASGSPRPGLSDFTTDDNRNMKPKYRPMTELIREFDVSSIEEKRRMAKLLVMAGFLPKNAGETIAEATASANLMDVTTAYGDLLASAASRFAQGHAVTPEQLLEQNIRYNMAAAGFKDADTANFNDKTVNRWASGADSGNVEEDLSGTHVTRQKFVDIYSREDARGLARATLRRELDRDPTEAEFEDFVSSLQAFTKDNPRTAVTRTTTDADGKVISEKTTNRGGVSEAGVSEFLQDKAEEQPGYAEWQAMGTFFPALMQALGSAVPGA